MARCAVRRGDGGGRTAARTRCTAFRRSCRTHSAGLAGEAPKTVSRATPRDRSSAHGSEPVGSTALVADAALGVDPDALRNLAGDGGEHDAAAGGRRCSADPSDLCGSGARNAAGSPGGSPTSRPESSSADRDRSAGRSPRVRDSARTQTPGECPTTLFSGHQGLDERTGRTRESRPTRRRLTPTLCVVGKPGRLLA